MVTVTRIFLLDTTFLFATVEAEIKRFSFNDTMLLASFYDSFLCIWESPVHIYLTVSANSQCSMMTNTSRSLCSFETLYLDWPGTGIIPGGLGFLLAHHDKHCSEPA